MATRPIIEVDNVTISTERETLLEEINFTVAEQSVVVIAGPTGCGKTTLMKHMTGLAMPTSGDIRIGGESIVTADENAKQRFMEKFGVVYQSSALFGSMTLFENVALPLEELSTLSSELVSVIARQKLAAMHLGSYVHYLPDECSGGMKKRAALARALALDPPLLFLDEPSVGLDPITAARMDRLILELRVQLGTTIVIVTHDLDTIHTVADRVAVLNKGKLVADETPENIRAKEEGWLREFFTRAGERPSAASISNADASTTKAGTD